MDNRRRLVDLACLANLLLAAAMPLLLPERVAIHFGTRGVPDGWAPVGVEATLSALVTLVLYGALRSGAWLTGRWPALSNLPNKDWWLAPERRELALDMLRMRLHTFGAVLLFLLLGLGLLTVVANLSRPVRLPMIPFGLLLGGFLAYTLYWVAEYLRAFRRPPPG